jgi:SAM-dependent methyltransferase
MAGTPDHTSTLSPNDEATRAWDGPLYDRWVLFREVVTTGLAEHGEEGLRALAPRPGDRVLDVGCGFGDTARRLAELVGPSGRVVGVDVAPRFVETARREAADAGVANASFAVVDVQTGELPGGFDLAFSRFGTMFFASPVAALRNIRGALVPGGRLVMVVWRRREDNDWLYRAQTIVDAIVERPEEFDEPTCGPGPFSMADADTLSFQLVLAGFRDVSLRRCDLSINFGRDVDEAVELCMMLGPAGETLRVAGAGAAHQHDEVRRSLREGYADFVGPDGVRAPASTWIVSATVPGPEG